MIPRLRPVWLVLAAAGAAHAWWLWAQGGEWAPAGGDMAIAALTLSLWALAETAVRRNWEALAAIPAVWLIGPGCGLPLYLFLRARPVR
ncbi:DUF2834 domain-containing protein [Ruixingdingia sedimenti]|uniref:DUF2834 domain-containing protein n=1 Tax=Ruixingdingia sedimenti TaxID=3073604 RepID=UPI003CE565CE